MKKIILVIIVTTITIGIYFIINSKRDIENVLSKYDTYESDGYYNIQNDTGSAGYIVSNKTEDGYKYGYVNYKGKILLDAEYNKIYRVMEVESQNKIYLIAEKDGRYGVSLNGKILINYEYQFIEYNNAIKGFILQKSENYGVSNIKGKIIIPVKNDSIEIKGKYIYVSNEEENKVYDLKGVEQNIDFDTSINPTESEEYFILITKKQENYIYGIVDKNEKELVKPQYTYIEYLFDNYFVAANTNNKEGIIDQNNNIKLKFEYNLVQKIQNTNLIRTLNNETNQTEIYSQDLKKICSMKDANIEKSGNTIKIYNETEEKYFNENGIEIKK